LISAVKPSGLTLRHRPAPPRPATHQEYTVWVAGRGSGPVPQAFGGCQTHTRQELGLVPQDQAEGPFCT